MSEHEPSEKVQTEKLSLQLQAHHDRIVAELNQRSRDWGVSKLDIIKGWRPWHPHA